MSSSRNHYLDIFTSLRVAAPDHAVTDLNKDERGDGLSERRCYFQGYMETFSLK